MKNKLCYAAILAVLSLMTSCSSIPSTPGAVAKRALQAIEDRDCGWLAKYGTEITKRDKTRNPAVDKMPTEDEFRQKCESAPKPESNKSKLEKIIIDKEEINGDNASVSLTLLREDKTATKETLRMHKTDGLWITER